MPQVRLEVSDAGGKTLSTPDGGRFYLPQRRLLAWVRFGREYKMRRAPIDTGAPACILSKRVWTHFDTVGDIAWVAYPPNGPNHDELPRMNVFSGLYPYRLGRIRLELLDAGTGQLPAGAVLVICTEDEPANEGDPPQLPPLLLIGLADVMHGRTLLIGASADGQRWAATLSEP